MEDGYEIEPFMPGISPIGKGTPAMKEFSVARPYIPDGTGYNLIRPKPGASGLRKNLEGLGRISYDYTLTDSGLERIYEVKKPPSNFLTKQKTPEAHRNAVQNFDANIRKHKSYASYLPTYDTIVVGNDPHNARTTRHEVAHALQDRRRNIARPSTYTVTGEELDARIVEHKGIRKGMKDWAKDAPKYSEYYKKQDLPGEGKLRDVAAKGIGKAAELVPNKPGRFTGRVPNFKGMGAGLVDMFMEGPELQKAKTDPLYGMGDDERARIEAAYEYGI